MRKISFILLGAAAAAAVILISIAESLGEDEAIAIGILFEILLPLLLLAAVITALVAFVRQKPRSSVAYLAIALPLLGLAVFSYAVIPQVRKPILKMRAKAGDATAQYELGTQHTVHGISSDEESAKALYWLKQAAEQGHLAAQLSLGEHYLWQRELDKAEQWLEPLANSTQDGWERLNARSRMEILAQFRSEDFEKENSSVTTNSSSGIAK